jgi:hypothetical protein
MNLGPFFHHFGMSSPDAITLRNDKLYVATSFWSEYFNSLRKCWEPLCEKIQAEGLYEQVSLRDSSSDIFFYIVIHMVLVGVKRKGSFSSK